MAAVKLKKNGAGKTIYVTIHQQCPLTYINNKSFHHIEYQQKTKQKKTASSYIFHLRSHQNHQGTPLLKDLRCKLPRKAAMVIITILNVTRHTKSINIQLVISFFLLLQAKCKYF